MKSQRNAFVTVNFDMLFGALSIFLFAVFATCQPIMAQRSGIHPNEEQVAAKNAERDQPKIEICFVLDTTGSMSGLIQGAKDKIWTITNELIESKPKPDIKFGLIGYRDRGDTYITKLTDMTDDVDRIYSNLTAFRANGGNDTPESVNQALHEAVQKMKWSKDKSVLRIIFLVGDAPPHMDYEDDVKYPKVCAQAAEKGIIINTIQCGHSHATEEVWKKIAKLGKGEYAAIRQNGGTVDITTPFDAEIAKVNSSINLTVCGYGDALVQSSIQGKIRSNESAKKEAIADRAQFFSLTRKSVGGGLGGGGGAVIGGNNDLVQLLMEKKIKYSEVTKTKLPKELQNLSQEKLETELKKRIKDRRKLQNEIDALVKKRSDFIKKKKAEQKSKGKVDSFDQQVKDMIQKQIKTVKSK